MMLVLEPNGTLVMYCGMVKVCFACRQYILLYSSMSLYNLFNPKSQYKACWPRSFFLINQDLGRQANLPALTFNKNKNNYEETRHKPSQSS